LSRGVSMRAALDEQGFTAKNSKQNRLVAWEQSEFKVLEKILNNHGLRRDVKGATYAHQTVEDYKESQAEKKITATKTWTAANTVEQLRQENSVLKYEKEKLSAEKYSPWKSFFYSVPEKQSFVQAELARLQIPFREAENGFEAQECYVGKIRELEKEFKPKSNTYREELRDSIDRFVMLYKSFDEVLARLQSAGCDVKRGKYVAVKPKDGNGFIRLKSLGEDYSEQAIRNRLVNNQRFVSDVDSKIASAKSPDKLEVMANKTIKHYTIVFVQGVLPVRKKNKKKPFSWTNDAELDRLSELNKKINAGATLENLRKDFAALETGVAEKESKLATLKSELGFFNDLYIKGMRCFGEGQTSEKDMAYLVEHKITATNYQRINELVAANEAEVAALEKSLSEERMKLKDTSETLTAFEKITGGTYVQGLIEAEKQRRQAEYIQNGIKRAD